MNKVKISIIIVNYKVKDELFSLLRSIYNSKSNLSSEVIVVNNDEDDLLEKFLKAQFKFVRYIKSPRNLGFGGGNNLGANIAKGEYLFFLNPDTEITPNALDNLYDFISKNKNAGIVSPLLMDKNLKPLSVQGTEELTPLRAIWSFSFLRKIFPNKSILNDKNTREWDYKTPKKVKAVPGAAIMIKKELFEKIGKFDEKFFLYFEENDLSKRVNGLGYDLFIVPQSKIIHKIGQSTKKVKEIEKYYKKSRFLYFRKHYGFTKALITELILRLNKKNFFVLSFIVLGFFLRIYDISNSMIFIGDQGWFYLSARDIIVDGKIPLVGITSSHTWLHQGPLWTYMLSVFLLIFNFNPLAGVYLTILFGVATSFLVYKIGSELFSRNVGIIGGFLYASSPLVVLFDRMPFDPSPIPFFTILYFYSIYKWVNGRILYFPLVITLLAILYSLELATFSLFLPLLLIFIYGFFKRLSWFKEIFNFKIITYSVLGFLAVMLPIIVYDLSNGFKQTIIFLGWVFVYKPFSFLFNHAPDVPSTGFSIVINFLLQSIRKIVFEFNLIVSILLCGTSIIVLIKDIFKNRLNLKNPYLLLLIFILVSFGGIIINKSPSDAYLPITFPFIILALAILLNHLISIKQIKFLSLGVVVVIIIFNSYSSIKINQTNELKNRINAVNKIITLTDNQKYNLVGKGQGSQFESFTMNYEYLLWWKGLPPSKENEKIKIILSEGSKGIDVQRK